MRRLNLIAALLLAAAISACAPNPIIARDPVPAPGPMDAYRCDSKPLPLNAFMSDCRAVPVAPQAVVRARG
ncbi:hypothetical protein [Methylobacterium sp. NEAU K]|uniref:hypothetical protein n=1 Tax=Methylobacterium sp. NEAU K TaxID=3064946 RepID=UPI002733AF14|nr:hypothetical protein [Methylobacterium sp. NEAU K]MDP4002088.1 hypothetical protein [Methylobacterium sp. NEAU K]